jgi:hypothetical protein
VRAAQAQRYASMSMRSKGENLELVVRLDPSQAVQRIIRFSDDMKAQSDKDAWLALIAGPRGHGTFQHRVLGESIYVQKRPDWKNSQHGLLIRLEPCSIGTALHASRRLNPWTLAFIRLWSIGVCLFGGFAGISLSLQVVRGEKQVAELVWLFVPLGMLMFCLLFVLVGRQLAKKELIEIWEWLNNIFADAKAEPKSTEE